MKITITDTILDGNLGDGWRDQYDAALAFAAFREGFIRGYVAGSYPGADLTVTIDVQRHTEGHTGGATVDVSDCESEEADRVERDLTEYLAAGSDAAWEAFCGSDAAERLSTDED